MMGWTEAASNVLPVGHMHPNRGQANRQQGSWHDGVTGKH